MRRRVRPSLLTAAAAALLILGAAAPPAGSAATPPPRPTIDAAAPEIGDPAPVDSVALETAAAVIGLFRLKHDEAWPGYDLARRPLLVYLPERWAVLLNAPHPVEGFTAYPEDWPGLGAPAQLHRGPLGHLIGQLVFGLSLDSVTTVAIPLSPDFGSDRRGAIGNGLAFIVHEAFHQYQQDAFRSIADDQPDEAYPILDGENTALASLEMHLLMDAVRASAGGDTGRTRELAGEFTAVREARWNRRPSLLPGFERPQELMEGSAKYVEIRCVGLMGDLCRPAGPAPPPLPGCDVFEGVTTAAYLLSDFEDRLHDGVVDPPDMARNRMYPTASAIALLLDFFDIDWKARVSDPAASPGLAEMLRDGLHLDGVLADSLLARARSRYDYDRLRAACDRLAGAYPLEYRAAVDSFESRPGFQVSVELPISGLTRSRSCEGKRWVLDQPTRSFSARCRAYTLKWVGRDDLLIEVHDSGIAEETRGDGTRRRVTFISPDIREMEIDGRPVDPGRNGAVHFERIILSGAGFRIRCEGEGTLAVDGRRLAVQLIRPR